MTSTPFVEPCLRLNDEYRFWLLRARVLPGEADPARVPPPPPLAVAVWLVSPPRGWGEAGPPVDRPGVAVLPSEDAVGNPPRRGGVLKALPFIQWGPSGVPPLTLPGEVAVVPPADGVVVGGCKTKPVGEKPVADVATGGVAVAGGICPVRILL